MDLHAPKQSDYDYVEWSGRAPVVSPSVARPALGDLDTTQVWLATDRQLRYWTGELGVTIHEIRDAIALAGTRCATAVRNCLGR